MREGDIESSGPPPYSLEMHILRQGRGQSTVSGDHRGKRTRKLDKTSQYSNTRSERRILTCSGYVRVVKMNVDGRRAGIRSGRRLPESPSEEGLEEPLIDDDDESVAVLLQRLAWRDDLQTGLGQLCASHKIQPNLGRECVK